MNPICEQVTSRFPEVIPLIECVEDLPYLVVGAIADWLHGLRTEAIDGTIISRVRDFRDWCRAQAPGKDAGDDAMTVYMVAFFENLFGYETTERLIPHLMDLSEFQQNRDYLTAWVGEQDYQSALAKYGGGYSK